MLNLILSNFASKLLYDWPPEVLEKIGTNTWITNVLGPILDVLQAALLPLLIIIGTAGSIYAIILGVNFARAESADKREEAKKRMINAIVGIVVMIALLVILQLFVVNAGGIVQMIQNIS